MEKFSVLMSLYLKEKPEYFRQCMDSILNQTMQPEQIVIVKDGPLTNELEKVLKQYTAGKDNLYTIVPLKKNMGLGLALAEGILHCRNNLIARMDTDDIAVKNRFELQIEEFKKNPDLDICGGNILEFEDSPQHIVAERNVPLTDSEIKKYQKRRDAFNHVTVMYKRDMVLKAGNYQSCLLMEDTLLWVHMILSGAKCMNINKPLVFVRIGKDMFKRRGGWSYYQKYKNGRKQVYETGYISKYDYYYTLLVQLLVALMPQHMRGFVFKRILHR